MTTSALGVVFWAGASRLYSPQELGEDAALVSAMILLSTVSQLNLGMGITRLLPQVQLRRWRPVLAAYALTALVGSVLTGAFLAVVPRLFGGFAFLAHDPTLGLALLGAVVLFNIFALQDAVLTAARWAVAIPVENGLFGLLKIALMVSLAGTLVGHGVFLAWAAAMAILLVPVNGLIFAKVLPSTGGRVGPLPTVVPLTERALVTRYLATDYLAALLSQGSNSLLPLLVVAVLGRAENAYFYVSFLIVGAVLALAQSLSTSLVVEGAHDEANLVALARRSVARYATFIAPGVALAVVGAPLLLRPFGSAYVTNGTVLLRLLLAATVPNAVIVLYLGVERVRARVSRVLTTEAALLVLVSTGAVVGMRSHGLTGLGVAWLAAQAGVAVVVAPRLWRIIGGPESEQLAPVGRGFRTTMDMGGRKAPPAAAPAVRDFVDIGAALVTAAILVVVGLGVTGVGRLLLALVFVSFVPGWAVLNFVPRVDDAWRVVLAVTFSISLCALVTVSTLWLHLWHPRVVLDVAGALCLLALLWHLAYPTSARTPA
jgi:hypothetical protein